MRKEVYQIKKCHLGVRLDLVLRKNLTQFSRNYIINLIKDGYVKINDIPIHTPSMKIKTLGNINIFIREEKENREKMNIKLKIVFEDESLIIINKPAGVLTHASKGNNSLSLVDILIDSNIKLYEGKEKIRKGVVHRLDKDTSGLIVFAKTKQASNSLANQFFLRQINKKYDVIVWNKPQPLRGMIDIPISTYNKKKKASYEKNAKNALTEYNTFKSYYNFFSLVECKIFTGRTHQIRIHMLSINCPVIGDKLYAKGRNLSSKIPTDKAKFVKSFERQALHAKELQFVHPIRQTKMTFHAKKPKDFMKLESMLFQDQ